MLIVVENHINVVIILKHNWLLLWKMKC